MNQEELKALALEVATKTVGFHWDGSLFAFTDALFAAVQEKMGPVECQYAKDVSMPEHKCAGKCQYTHPSFTAPQQEPNPKTSVRNVDSPVVGAAPLPEELKCQEV